MDKQIKEGFNLLNYYTALQYKANDSTLRSIYKNMCDMIMKQITLLLEKELEIFFNLSNEGIDLSLQNTQNNSSTNMAISDLVREKGLIPLDVKTKEDILVVNMNFLPLSWIEKSEEGIIVELEEVYKIKVLLIDDSRVNTTIANSHLPIYRI